MFYNDKLLLLLYEIQNTADINPGPNQEGPRDEVRAKIGPFQPAQPTTWTGERDRRVT